MPLPLRLQLPSTNHWREEALLGVRNCVLIFDEAAAGVVAAATPALLAGLFLLGSAT